jgi:hypothetical protein
MAQGADHPCGAPKSISQMRRKLELGPPNGPSRIMGLVARAFGALYNHAIVGLRGVATASTACPPPRVGS